MDANDTELNTCDQALKDVTKSGENESENLKEIEIGTDKKIIHLSDKPISNIITTRRKLWVLFSFLFVVLTTGCTHWGWDGMQDILTKGEAYSWLCDDADSNDCPARRRSINNLYTISIGAQFGFSMFAGLILDRFGPKLTAVLGQSQLALGWVILLVSSQSIPLYPLAFALIGMAGDTIYFPLLSISKLFAARESLILAIMGSVRSLSFSMPVLMSLFSSSVFPELPVYVIVLSYLAIGVLPSVLFSVFLVPRKAYKAPTVDADNTENRSADLVNENSQQEKPNKIKNLENQSIGSALFSVEFILFIAYFCFNLLRSEFFTKSHRDQLSSGNANLFRFFSIANICSFIPGPIFGYITDRFNIYICLLLLNTAGFAMYFFVIWTSMILKGAAVTAMMFFTSFILSSLYCYIAVEFNPAHFGKLAGIASLVGGMFTLSSILIYDQASSVSGGFLIVDIFMMGFAAINYAIATYLMVRKRKKSALRSKELPSIAKEV